MKTRPSPRKTNDPAAKLAAKSKIRSDIFSPRAENTRTQSSHEGENSTSTREGPKPDRITPGNSSVLWRSRSPSTFQTCIWVKPGSSTTIHFLLAHACGTVPISRPAIHTILSDVAESRTPTSSTLDTSTTHRSEFEEQKSWEMSTLFVATHPNAME
ncbi:hypothetical protein Pelo_17400 [Pelomyxa schiedti]|nr:hypothetical protein Pelo_17400 [Pelomyxa schiedti]